MMPFGNELDVVTVKGKNIRDQLEISVKDWSSKGESGRFLQMSGKLIYYIPTINTADFTDFDIILSNPPRQISLLTKSAPVLLRPYANQYVFIRATWKY